MNELYKKLIKKQKRLISLIGRKYMFKDLRDEISQLEKEIEKETITDADIEAWAAGRVNEIDPNNYRYGDLLIEGAKAVLNGEIKHIDK